VGWPFPKWHFHLCRIEFSLETVKESIKEIIEVSFNSSDSKDRKPTMKISSTGKIDIFCHILPLKYKEALYKKAKPCFYLAADSARPALFDLDIRFRVMDKFEGLRQVLTIGTPPLEYLVTPQEAMELARIANDEMAELLIKYPDRFVAAVACLPMNTIDAALQETDRAIGELNLKGVQIYSPLNGKPLDRPEFMALYEKMAQFDLPIWIHPARDNNIPDYPDEKESKYKLFVIFGWPYETTLAMSRLVFSGVLEKYPDIKFITHHCGAMIPFFEQRILSVQVSDAVIHTGEGQKPGKSPLEYFKKFYADTVLSGSSPALMCGYTFFGPDHMLFASDYPYPGGPEKGDIKLGEAIKAVESMAVPQMAKEKIFKKNAERLLHLQT